LAAEGGPDKKAEPELNKDLPEVKYVHKRTPLEKLKGFMNSIKKSLNTLSANKPEKKKESDNQVKQVGDLWTKEEYDERLENPAVTTMAIGISTAANSEWGGVGASMNTDMSEEEKQEFFKEDGLKTMCILMMEFHQGIGNQTRVFNESEGHAITEDVKWSAQTYIALKHLEEQWKNNKIKIGEQLDYKSNTSPRQTGIVTAFWAHGNQYFYNRTSFYLGGMEYSMWIYQDKIVFKVVNELTISSGVTKDNGNSNLIRVKGETCPLGNTKQVFWFTHSLPSGPPPR